jgi:uncharacterized membrane protein YgcG
MQKGDKIQLKNQEVEVEECKVCGGLMVNLDVDQLAEGDLVTLKKEGVVISNPDTDKLVCVKCEYKTFGRKVADFFESVDDNDDTPFFTPSSHPSGGGLFGGGSNFGGFGGFGGGGFGGGGASAHF